MVKNQKIAKSKPTGKTNKKKPRTDTNKILKSDNINDLKTELVRINEQARKGPASSLKNKVKRRELVMQRNSMKKKLKAKIRRKNQKTREECGDDAVPTEIPKTIEMMKEADDTQIDLENDEEITEEMKHDEYSSYFNKEYEPQILLTTSIKHTGAIFKFMRELKETIPNSYFYYRKKANLKGIIEIAKEKGFTDVVVVYERLRKPYSMVISHLPDGPTCEFKIFNPIYHDEIEGSGKSNNHSPEMIFKNFNSKVGFRLSRILNGLFPHTPHIEGRQVVTFHNQRDYIFFRHHRFIFDDDFTKCNLQEIGPRFTLRLLSIQRGTFDNQFGEYEFYYKNKMGVRRRKFHL